MKEDNFFWKYEYEPGKQRKNNTIQDKKIEPLISIITSYYNGNTYMWQTINCVLNQTFEAWEWIIVDDGSTSKEAIRYLEQVEKIDTRIKVYHKKNEGLALGRDYAIQKTTNTKYVVPLDDDDLIEPTYLETLYFALETNPEATWAFTNSVGFGKYIYLADAKFDSQRMKTDNHITATALIRKEAIQVLGGYGKAKKYVNEDWHLWLRMLANRMFPVQVGFYGFWYRRRKESLLSDINNEKKQEYQQKMKDLKKEADKIQNKIEAIEYPKQETEDKLQENQLPIDNIEKIKIAKYNQKSDIYILPYLGTDKKLYQKIKKATKERNIYVITLEQSKHSSYMYRQKYEQFCTVYDVPTFLDKKYWISFIQYIINSRKVDKIYLSHTKYQKELKKKWETIEISKCQNNDRLYNIKKMQYKITHTLPIRAIKKIIRCINRKEA